MANEFRVKNGIIVSSIATESGNFTIDSAADIVLDAGGTDIIFANAGTNFGKIHDSSSSLRIKVIVADDDFVVAGNDSDGESNFDAFKLDMSAAGAATFSGGIAQAGTISAGTWNGGVIASAYLDADTAQLSGTQTFTGNKTFTGTVTVGADDTGKDVKFFGATSGSYMLWDESTDDLILGGAAKLGIGTASPSSELEVAGNTTGNVQITIDNDNTAGLGTFALQEDGSTTGIFQYRGSTNGTLPNTVRVGSNVAGGSLAFTYAGGTTGMYIKGSDGNVGIGITAPLFPLHLKYTDNRTDPQGSNSSSGAGAIGANAQGGGLYIENASTTDGSFAGITFRTDTADGRIAYQSTGSSLINEGQMSFYCDANDTGGQQLVLEEVLRLTGGGSGAAQAYNSAYVNGRLGIGTSSPSTNLHVVSGVSNSASMVLENTNNDANSGPVLELFRNPADNTVSSGDLIGKIAFKGHFYDGSDYDQTKEWASITSEIEHYQGDGSVSFNVLQNGSSTPYLKVNGNAQDIVFNDGSSNDFDVRIESDADANNFFSDGSAGRIGIGTNAPAAKLHVDAGATAAPSLTFGAVAGQILQNENSEFAFGLDDDSPYSLWIQGRNSGNAARDISLQPLGGKIGIGTDAPSSLLHIHGNMADGKQGILITRNDTSTVESNMLGGIGFDSNDGNIPSKITEASVALVGYASENHATTDKGGYLSVLLTEINDDDDTVSTEALRVSTVSAGTSSTLTLKNGNASMPADTKYTGIDFHNVDSSGAGVGAAINAMSAASGRGGYLEFQTGTTVGAVSTKLTIKDDGAIQSSLGNLNTCVVYTWNRSDMNSGAVNLKATTNDYSSSQNHWGYIMPKTGRVKMLALNTRNQEVTGTAEQTWKINRNNNNGGTAGTDHFALSVQKGGSQDDTGVSGDAHMVIAATSHSSTIYQGSVVVNFAFAAGDEIRIQRTDAASVDMGDVVGQMFVEFD